MADAFGAQRADPPAKGGQTLVIGVLLAQITFGLLAMTICLPSMQEWSAIFHADQASVQLTFSGFVVTYGAMQLLYGPLSDRHGRRRVLLVGLAVSCCASLLGAMSTSLPAVTLARMLQGVGCAATLVVGRSMVQDLFSGAERTRVMAFIGMALGLSPPMGSLIGGQLHVRIGWQANFVLVGGIALALMLAAWRVLPNRPGAASVQGRWLSDMGRAYARLARERSFLLFCAILASSTAAFYAFLAGAPLVLRSYGIGPQGVGFYIMVIPLSYIFGNFMTSRLVARIGERRVLRAGQFWCFAGLLLLLAGGAAGLHHPLAFTLPLLLLGLGHGLLVPTSVSSTVGAVPAIAGAAAAVAGVLQQLLGALGGFTVGLVTHQGALNLALIMLGWSVLGLAAQLMLPARAESQA